MKQAQPSRGGDPVGKAVADDYDLLLRRHVNVLTLVAYGAEVTLAAITFASPPKIRVVVA